LTATRTAFVVARGKFGLRIPEEIAIVGFDNCGLAASQAYSLTTCKQARQERVRAIIAMILGTVEAETITLPPKLVIRNST